MSSNVVSTPARSVIQKLLAFLSALHCRRRLRDLDFARAVSLTDSVATMSAMTIKRTLSRACAQNITLSTSLMPERCPVMNLSRRTQSLFITLGAVPTEIT